MASKAHSEDVQHVVHISTDSPNRCEQCSEQTGGIRFAHSVNHYIEAHGYRLLQ